MDIARLIYTFAGIFISSVFIYFAIRFFAYKRSFPLPHQFDFLWIVLTLLLLFMASALQPPLESRLNPMLLTWMTFLTYLLSCYLMIFVVDQFFVEYFLVSMLKLYIAPPLRKVLGLFIFAVAVVVGVQKIFSINPWAVYAPTSVISLGIGIALKDAFQTFFAGVALSRIVHIGDWISLGDKEGEVTDINWARTVLRTWEGAYIFIPNSQLQSGVFSSYSYNDQKQRCRLEVGTSYDAPPQRVKRVLLKCVQNVDGVRTDPPPEVLLLSYADFSINYALTFWVEDYSRRREVASDVSTRIWYVFKREGIEIPFPIRTVHMVQDRPKEAAAHPEALLATIDLFKLLSSEERQKAASRLKKQQYLGGEVVVREGDPGSSFYIVSKGRLEVTKDLNGRVHRISELGAGQFFGELSLLTGEPRAATVRALADSELLRLEKQDFREILESHPSLAESLAEVVASRQAVLVEQSTRQASEAIVESKKSNLSRQIREFFNLRGD